MKNVKREEYQSHTTNKWIARRNERLKAESFEKRVLNIIIGLLVVMIFGIGFLVYRSTKPRVVNNYNIEKVETLVIPEESYKGTAYQKYEYPQGQSDERCEIVEDITEHIRYKTQDVNFVKYNTEIYGYVISEENQMRLWDISKKYKINFIELLAICYQERARNDQFATNVNKNGTKDIGLMQINTSNKRVIEKVANKYGVQDVEQVLYIPEANIEIACRIIADNKKKPLVKDNLICSLVAYNGGYGAVQKIHSGEWTMECDAGKYAQAVLKIINKLNKEYV